MFITHQLTPLEVLSELVNLKFASSEDTQRFARLGHDKDLCPGFRDRVDAMLETYKSHRCDVQDIQGMRDDGVDVLLRYCDEEDHRIGLQIKSYKEIEDWRMKRDKNFVMRLKAQLATAVTNADIDYYYVLLCADENIHKTQIRTICSELKNFENVRIVRPREALAFFELDGIWISSFVTRMLCKSDVLLKDAIDVASKMEPDLAFIKLTLMCMACEGQVQVTQDNLFEVYSEWTDLAPAVDTEKDRLSDLLWDLDGAGLDMSVGELDALRISEFPTSWTALYFDQFHRHRGEVRDRLAVLLDIIPASPQPRRR